MAVTFDIFFSATKPHQEMNFKSSITPGQRFTRLLTACGLSSPSFPEEPGSVDDYIAWYHPNQVTLS